MSTQYFLSEALADAVKAKRGTKGLREVAAEIGSVSPATLSRIENRSTPDLPVLLLVCSWLGRPVADFIGSTPANLPPALDNWVRAERSRAKLLRQEAERFQQTADTAERVIRYALDRFAAGESVDAILSRPGA